METPQEVLQKVHDLLEVGTSHLYICNVVKFIWYCKDISEELKTETLQFLYDRRPDKSVNVEFYNHPLYNKHVTPEQIDPKTGKTLVVYSWWIDKTTTREYINEKRRFIQHIIKSDNDKV